MKKAYPFQVKFIETNLILNALMGIKELKFQKTDIIMYDMRDFEEFEKFHFCNSQHYDIGMWNDSYNAEFAKVTLFKHVFLIGDNNLYSSSDFDSFIESLSKAKLKANGIYFYNMDMKTIEDENCDGLLVFDQQKTKLFYYPSLVVENEHLCWGGIFLCNDRIEKLQLDKLWIGDSLYIGDLEKHKKVKANIKSISAVFSSEDAVDNTFHVCESACKLMKKSMGKKENFWIISSDPDNLGVLLAIYYLMNVRGYSYHEASKYVIGQRFRVTLTQNFQSFLQYLFISPDKRPESPKAIPNGLNNIPLLHLQTKAPEPEFKIEDTFQVKLRKKKLKKSKGSKKNLQENNPDDVKLQKAIESLYSQVKKDLGQLERTTQMLDTIIKKIIDDPEEAKFRSIKTSNEKFRENILRFKSAVTILEFYGFIISQNAEGEECYTFPTTTSITTLKGRRLQAQKCIQNYKTYKVMKRIK